jgi:hypothetical protein
MNAPVLKSGIKSAWLEFKTICKGYFQQGGVKEWYQMMDVQVITYYQVRLNINMTDPTTFPTIENLIDNFHDKSLNKNNIPLMLSIHAMKERKTFNEDECVEYMMKFINLVANNNIISQEAEEKEVVTAFLQGFQPMSFRRMVMTRKSDTFDEAIEKVDQAIEMMKQYLHVDSLVREHHTPQQQQQQQQQQYQQQQHGISVEGKMAAAAVTNTGAFFCDNHQSFGNHKGFYCPQKAKCLRCPNSNHPSRDPKCPFQIAWKSEHPNTARYKKANMVSSTSSSTDDYDNVDVDEEEFQKLCSHMAKQNPQKVNNIFDNNYNILFDSGGSHTFIHDKQYFDDNSLSLCSMEGVQDSVTIANGEKLPVKGKGLFMGMTADYVPLLNNTLISISKLTKQSNQLAIFDENEMVCIKRSDEINNLIDKLLLVAKQNNLVTIKAKQSNGLYKSTFQNLSTVNNDLQVQMMKKHNSDDCCVTNAAYYQTAVLKNQTEIVKFFHESWNHASMETMIQMVKNNMLNNIPRDLTEATIRKYFPQCTACPIGNMSKRPMLTEKETSYVYELGEQMIMDVKGPYTDALGKKVPSFSGALYSISAIDRASGYEIGWTVKNVKNLIKIVRKLDNEVKFMKRELKSIKVDDAFMTEEIKEYCQVHGITLIPSTPHEHGTIGIVERRNRTTQDSIVKNLDLTHKTHLDNRFWAMCFHDCRYKGNLQPTLKRPNKSPYSIWNNGKVVDLKNTPLLPFGSIVMAHIPLNLQTTLGGRSHETYYVGCAQGYKGGVMLYNPLTKRQIVRRTFKVIGPMKQASLDYRIPILMESVDPSNEEGITVDDNQEIMESATNENSITKNPMNTTSNRKEELSIEQESLKLDVNHLQKNKLGKYSVRKFLKHSGPKSHKKSKYVFWISWVGLDLISKIKYAQAKECDCFHQYIDEHKELEWLRPMRDVNNTSIEKIINEISKQEHKASDENITNNNKSGNNIVVSEAKKNSKTLNMKQVLLSPHREPFIIAKQKELESFVKLGVWKLPDVDIASIPKQLILPSRALFDEVYNADGTFKKHKCRITAGGHKWVNADGIDLYAGTVQAENIKIIAAIAAELDLITESIDIKTAFLHGKRHSDSKLYMRRPTGFTDEDMPEVVELMKSIYGLPEASARFREHSNDCLINLGFRRMITDNCVYRLDRGSDFIIATVHVDDIGFATNSAQILKDVKDGLKETYEITEIKDMNQYLGMRIERDRPNKTITLYQDGYIESIIDKYNILKHDGTKYPSTPMLMIDEQRLDSISNSKEISTNLKLTGEEITLYKSKTGSLTYLAKNTRPDILYAVNSLSQHQQTPSSKDMIAADRVLSYIAGTREIGLRLHSGEGIILYATVDASYGCHLDMKSHTGCTMHIGRNSGSFASYSGKQSITADSSTVAEWIAAHRAAKFVMGFRIFLKELGFEQMEPTILYEDNLSTIATINNNDAGKRTRHIDIKYNMIKEQVKNQVIIMKHLSGADMTSDILTKSTGPTIFKHLRPKLQGMNVSRSVKKHLVIQNGRILLL